MIEPLVRFTVEGKPEPQGSMTPYFHKGLDKAMCKHSNEKALKAWRKLVAERAHVSMRIAGHYEPFDVALALVVVFYVTRPKSASKRESPEVKPDLDKLVRAIGDAGEKVVWRSDSRIVKTMSEKVYADARPPGVQVAVYPAEHGPTQGELL